MKTLKKTKLAWGIVLLVIGVIGLAGMKTVETMLIVYIPTCLACIGCGILLLVLYMRDKKAYEEALAKNREKEQEKQRLAESRMELDKMRVNRELSQLKADTESIKVCPTCGGTSRGDICEYCGSKL